MVEKKIFDSIIISEISRTVKQVNSSLDSSQNEANAILAKSFIKIRELEQAVNILAAVEIDEILAAFIVTVLGGVQV
jgi:hypothetical protein